MSTAEIPGDPRLEGVPTREILEGLARLHELVLVVDGHGRIVWLSEPLERLAEERGVGLGERWTSLLARLPDPQRARGLGQSLCERGHLQSVRVSVPDRTGASIEMDVSAFKVLQRAREGADGRGLTVVILRRAEDRDREARALDDRLDLFREILDAAPDAVIALDRSSFVTYANPAAESLLGERADEICGRPIALFLPHAAGFGKIASNLQPHDDPSAREIEMLTSGGGAIWLSITTRVLRDAQGASVGSVAYLRDVTAARRERERMQQQNAELESFVHSVSHDLRSPLVSLLGFSRLLRQDYEDRLDAAGLHFLERIEQAGRTMDSLIQDLLELSRIGRPGDQRSWVDPRAVLLQLQAELKPRLEEAQVRLVLPPSPPLLLCDRTRIYQVFSNLVGNALLHMGPCDEPTIRVEITEEAERHHIAVSDNGRGIPQSEHDRIFQPFHTVGRRGDGDRSSGMGLAIVKRIAEAHNGRVWVESEIDRGATFHFTLPR